MKLPKKLLEIYEVDVRNKNRDTEDIKKFFKRMGCQHIEDMVGHSGSSILNFIDNSSIGKHDRFFMTFANEINRDQIKSNIMANDRLNYVDYMTRIKMSENHKFYDLVVNVSYLNIYDYRGDV